VNQGAQAMAERVRHEATTCGIDLDQ